MKNTYTQVPGRGLMSQTAFDLRMNHLETLLQGAFEDLKSESIQLSQIQNNIESFIGTTEIPLGLVGPILFCEHDKEPEWVHAAVATTEGALVASMNRGAKAISQCGGFKSYIVHQKMLRTPMFTFASMNETIVFDRWIKKNFKQIKSVAQQHSNYAELLEISSVLVGKIIHLKFIYTTCDASGQNMTTSCTWHSCLWIEDNFEKDTGIEILHFVIDGNGASDKKVSFYSMVNGRGTHVIGECFLTHDVIEKTLRTNANDMFRSFNHSMAIGRLDGMIGYNINVANTIAGIFASTGQDLASIHESSTAVLQMEHTKEGLYLSLSLPNLVVGTVGGGTHLPVPSRILELMDCKGAGKAERFSKLIVGFALSLEISTLAAIVSGQFARAHQKRGRNKPIKWLLKADVHESFIKQNMPYFPKDIKKVHFNQTSQIDNGILTQLTSKVSKKLIGFIQADVETVAGEIQPVLLKSKALGSEVLKGLHFMATNVSVDLADKLDQFKDSLEYKDCHKSEIEVCTALHSMAYPFMPTFYGSKIDVPREIHLFVMERLDAKNMLLFNDENNPEKWTEAVIRDVIDAIHIVHSSFLKEEATKMFESIGQFDIAEAIELYRCFTSINRKDYDYLDLDERFEQMNSFLASWNQSGYNPKTKLVLIHHDFNPRNVAVRNNGQPCIYDWELATFGLPQRDIFEFLAFALRPDLDQSRLKKILIHHYNLVKTLNTKEYCWNTYLSDFQLAGQAFLVARVNFYLSGSTLVNYSFIERVFKTSFAILDSIATLKIAKLQAVLTK